MSKRVGVTSMAILDNEGALKRAALLFDQVLLINHKGGEFLIPEKFKWLEDSQVIHRADQPFFENGKEVLDPGKINAGDILKAEFPTFLEGKRGFVSLFDLQFRGIPFALRERLGWDATCFRSRPKDRLSSLPEGRARVVDVILRILPRPDDATSWEEILKWRANKAVEEKLTRLVRWISNVNVGNFDSSALEDEIRCLMDDYTAFMKLHEIDSSAGVSKTAMVTIIEVLEKAVSLRWGQAANTLFDVADGGIKFIEAERNAPGRDVAYLVEARKTFHS